MSTTALARTHIKVAHIFTALAMAAFVVAAPLDRAFGWGASGSGGKPPSDYDKEQYKPKKLSPVDKAKLEKLIKRGQQIVDNSPKTDPSKTAQEFTDFKKQVQQLLDQLDNKGYDTDPEYAADVKSLKGEVSQPSPSNAYNPTGGFTPGSSGLGQ